MKNWVNIVNRIEGEAKIILKDYGYPIESADLNIVQPGDDRKVINAAGIIHGVFKLRKYVSDNRVNRALNELVSIFSFYEEMDILQNVPQYKNKVFLTDKFFRHIRHGAAADNARKSKYSKINSDEAKSLLKKLSLQNEGYKIGALREMVGEIYGVHAKTIARRTGNYNPIVKKS